MKNQQKLYSMKLWTMMNMIVLMIQLNISPSDIVEISKKLGYSVYCTVSIVNEVMKKIGYKKFAR
ncbi:hypothetical protein A3Q56_05982 [Intoshia linei]|uniref:HTH araC/xylS-type domain-containing protein n=1 Tax=Intoshia linei TaxID=1819745 RepID=A0A177AXS7_9BILA|nr:hypothetical protein A3Q56_05982 [Intoshia linei]